MPTETSTRWSEKVPDAFCPAERYTHPIQGIFPVSRGIGSFPQYVLIRP